MKKYGHIISELRKKKGLTQKQLGKKLNVSYQAVSKWENNLSEPDLETLEKLTDVFEISMSEFFAMSKDNDLNKIEQTEIKNQEKQLSHKIESKNFIKTKPWILIASLSVLAVALLFIAIFVPFKLSAEAIYNKVNPSVFYIKTQTVSGGTNTGTGFFINDHGLAVVDYDVVENCESGFIKFGDDKTYNIKSLVGVDEDLDIAIVQIDIKKSKGVKTANSNKVSIAEKVYTIGYSSSSESSLAETLISKVNYSNKNKYFQILTTSARNGSVLVNEQGKVVGMVSDRYSGDAGFDVAIPINQVMNIPKDINLSLLEYATLKLGTYKIVYDGNGATSGEMPVQEVLCRSYVNLRSNLFDRKGYTFGGWSFGSRTYNDAERVWSLGNQNETLTLTAIWLPITYYIDYDFINLGNGVYIDSYTADDADIVLNTVYKEGYNFVGWYEDAEFTKPISVIDTSRCENFYLRSKFEPITYTISYTLNGGELEGEFVNSYNIETETFELPNPVRSYYTFSHWHIEGNTSKIISNVELGSTGNLSLVAVWKENVYTMSLRDKEGEILDQKSVKTSEFKYNYNYQKPTGCYFVDYDLYFDSDCTQLLLSATDEKGYYTFSTPNNYDIYVNGYHTIDEFSYMKQSGYISSYKGSRSVVYIPEELKEIGQYVFYESDTIEEIYMNDNITTIGMRAIAYSPSLKYVKLSKGLTSFGYEVFTNSTALETIEIPENVTDIPSNTFSYCTSLHTVILPETLKTIGHAAFYHCDSLENIKIPASVEKIAGSMFWYCSSLKNVDMRCKATSIEESFYCCTALESVLLPENLTSIIGQCFYECESLKSIIIPSNVTELPSNLFWKCSSLVQATLPNGVTVLPSNLFYGCESLTTINIPTGLTEIQGSAFAGCHLLDNINLPSTLKIIEDYAFQNCFKLTKIELAEGFEKIGDMAFSECNLLENIIFPSTLKSIGHLAFQNCDVMTEAILPEGLEYLGRHAFFNCTNLAKVNIPSTITSLSKNPFEYTAFYNDKTNWTGDVLYLDNCLLDNDYASNFEIEEDTRIIAEGALSWSRITHFDLSKFSFDIPAEFFYYCRYMESIIIGKETKSIGDEAFYNCTALTRVYYTGTAEEFALITIGEGNECFTNATAYYYSEEQPTEEGNYWYYDDQGAVCIWGQEVES